MSQPPVSSPTPTLAGQALDMRLIRRFWSVARPRHQLVLLTLLIMPCTIAAELAQPLLFKWAVEDHIAPGIPAGLGVIALAYLSLLFLGALLSYIEQWVIQRLGQDATHTLRIAVYDHIMQQRAAYFDRTPVGRLMSRITNDIESLNEMFGAGVVSLLADFVKMTVILVIMFALDWRLTLLTMATFPLLFGLIEYARRVMRRSFRYVRSRLAAMNAFAQEHLIGMRVIHLLGRSDVAAREYDEISASHRDAYIESNRADAMMYALVEALGFVAIAGVAWFATTRGHGELATTLALAVVFIDYIGKFFIPLRDFSAKYAVMQGAMASLERIVEVLDTNERDAPPLTSTTAPRSDTPGAALEFRDVEFSYGAESVLGGVTFAVPLGSVVAVVGRTGAGKSTLARLLTRLYESDAGEIALAGRDVRTIPVAELRRRITVVSQDAHVFTGTIADNLRTEATITDDAMRAALVEVGLTELLGARAPRPEAGGLLALDVGQRGGSLSAGERQLLNFARALLRQPDVLVLDEATAHVDPVAEILIEKATSTLMRGRTTLIIAHRLSTIRAADQIIVLDRGRVAEMGPRAELLARGGLYADLERTFAQA